VRAPRFPARRVSACLRKGRQAVFPQACAKLSEAAGSAPTDLPQSLQNCSIASDRAAPGMPIAACCDTVH
jgi:hypothetical protein